MSRTDHPFWHVFAYHCPGSDNTAVTNCHPGVNEHFSGNPSLLTNVNRLCDKWETCFRIIVRAGDQVSALRHHGLAANGDFVLAIKRDAVGNAAPIGKFKVPRSPNRDLRVNVHSMAYFGAKTPEQKRPPSVQRFRRGTKEQRRKDSPYKSSQPVTQ